jgi:putative peptidoglycan lipid II flippase
MSGPFRVTALVLQIAQWRSRLMQIHPDHIRIARGAVRVSVFVLAGRCAGALKEMAIAWQYGISNIVDAYQLTFTLITWLPGTLATVLSVVLVPAFVELRKGTKIEQARFLGELEVAAVVVGALFAISLYLVWPFVLDMMAVKLSLDTRAMCRQLMLGMAPVGILTLTACVYAARLQSLERHINTLLEGVPAALVLIFVLVARDKHSMVPLMAGTTIGVVVQTIWMRFLAGRADGIRAGLSLSFRSPQWPRFYHSVRILMVGQLVMCFSIPLDQYFLAHLGDGAIATLGYANRVLALLLSMGALAIGRATLPILSEILSGGDYLRARDTALKWSFLMLAIGMVCVALSWLLALRVVELLFQRGAFTAQDTIAVANLFRWGLLQVPFFFAVLVLMQLFASEGRFRAMAVISLLSFVVKALANVLLISRLGITGVVLATGLMHAATFSFYLMFSRTSAIPGRHQAN